MLFAVTLTACSEPDAGPGRVAGDYLQALVSRDGAAAYKLLSSTATARLTTLTDRVKKTRALVLSTWPLPQREAALNGLGLAELVDVDTADALFQRLFTRAGQPVPVAGLAAVALRIRRVTVESDSATVTTYGGDSVRLTKEGDSWTVELPPDDQARLDALVAAADRGLTRVQAEADGLQRHRYGASSR